MSWQDILIDRSVTHDELKQAAAQVLHVAPEHVCVSRTPPDFDELLKTLCVVYIQTDALVGEFSLRLEIYLLTADLLQRVVQRNRTQSHSIEIALCNLLHCRGLISSDSYNPNSFLLIDAESPLEEVFIDIALLDSRSEIIFQK